MSFEISTEANSNRIENVEPIPVGMNLCILYGIADLGTQSTKFGDKRQIKLLFEFPLEKRVFWEGDEPKPSVISTTETMSLAEKANLRKKLIEPMIGRKLGKDEGYDPTELLGKAFVATVTHSPDGKWANISSISPLDEKNMKLFDLTTPSYPNTNDIFTFHLNDGFDSEKFKALPRNIRAKIKESNEGEEHQRGGGKFAEPDNKNNGGSSNAPTSPGQMGTSGKKLVMKPDAPYQYDALKGMNWTDDQIVAKEWAYWSQPTPPAQPQSAPAPAPAPTPAPAPAPSAAPTPEPAQPQIDTHNSNGSIILKPEWQGGESIDQWFAKGWTEEAMVEKNFAEYVKK